MDHLCEEHFTTIDYLISEGCSGHMIKKILVEDHELTDEESQNVMEAWWEMNGKKATPGNENISNEIKGDILARLNNGAHHQNKADIDIDMIGSPNGPLNGPPIGPPIGTPNGPQNGRPWSPTSTSS